MKLRLPLILDFRDPFGLHESGEEPPQGFGDRARRLFVDTAERHWLSRADYIVLSKTNALEAYRERYPFIESKSIFIRDHFDLALADPPQDTLNESGFGKCPKLQTTSVGK